MIKSKQQLKYYLQQDAIALNKANKKHPSLFGDEIWKFQRTMRKLEYYTNMKGKKKLFFIPFKVYYKVKYHNLSVKLGFSIPINVFGEGLSIAHYGTIVINGGARVGKNCRMHADVNIGATGGSRNAPQLGDNIFIGTGAKIIGDITIADDVAIGANAVVVKSIEEKGVTYAGIPAKKVSDKNSRSNLPKGLDF